MKQRYASVRFSSKSLAIIANANKIIEDYQAQGLVLTLRQLYYRFVASALLPNSQREYKKLGSVINDARLAGKIDWIAIEDRSRSVIHRSHWTDPSDIITSAAASYAIDKWKGQKYYVECFVEKQALESVIDNACNPYDVDVLACKGYVSQSECWRSAQRFLKQHQYNGRETKLIYLGDHDPSGLDMTRDLQHRLADVFGAPVEVVRIALNDDQIQQYNPPPNPAKLSDSRAESYIARFGDSSWELDALEPKVLHQLIQNAILQYLDLPQFKKMQKQEEREKNNLRKVAARWEDIAEEFGESEKDHEDVDEEPEEEEE